MSGRVRRRRGPVAGGEEGASACAPSELRLADVACCVCRGVLVEPVVLPCSHRYCRACWAAAAAEAVRCPLCRKRVGSWLRRARDHLVDEPLWAAIRSRFPAELRAQRQGVEVDALSPPEKPVVRLSAPGEIRTEYEAELGRLRAERLQLEQKHSHETEELARKLQEEEEEAHRVYLERVKEDELLAKQLQATTVSTDPQASEGTRHSSKLQLPSNSAGGVKRKAKRATIDTYLVKKKRKEQSPLVTEDDTTSTNSSVSSKVSKIKAASSAQAQNKQSPELVPSYKRFLNEYLDKKLRHLTGSMQKEPAARVKTWANNSKETEGQKEFPVDAPKVPIRTKGAQKELYTGPCSSQQVQSVPVSLPYTGFLSHKLATLSSGVSGKNSGSTETDSVDSMREELCYFKPIHPTANTLRSKSQLNEPLRVPAVRSVTGEVRALKTCGDPDYVIGLRRLRGDATALRRPSAFVCLLKLLQDSQEAVCDISELDRKTENTVIEPLPYNKLAKANVSSSGMKQQSDKADGPSSLDCTEKLGRTRSTGNIPKLVNESTPKKVKPKRKRNTSGKKSRSRKTSEPVKEFLSSPTVLGPVIAYKKVNLVSKNLSSPFETCEYVMSNKEKCKKPIKTLNNYDAIESNNNNSTPRKTKRKVSATLMEKIECSNSGLNGLSKQRSSPSKGDPDMLAQQLKIEQLLEQERQDLELAMKMEAEWNGVRARGRYGLRRTAVKRQLTLNYLINGAKKMKA